ncbi:uncharacterized protein LOC143914702 [Arctopsyche grandis]|uniref:uncharacterized protein LOC143914702 n=1 Tax=Arctopsyche grandis TaxID=121162 RepID=UPI00406D6487
MISQVTFLVVLVAASQAAPGIYDSYHAPVSYSVAAPIAKIAAPIYAPQVVHAAPVLQKTISYQAPQLVHAAPQYVQAAPQVVHAAPQYVQATPQVVHAAPQYVQAAPQVVHAAPQYVQAAPQYIHSAPVIQKQLIAKIAEPEPIDPNPKYSFAYGVTDPHTGDSKNAEEHLEDGVVHGSYSLVEPDGHVRKVTYTADHVNGFNAVVERTGEAKVVAAAPVAKVYAAAPVAKILAPTAFGGHSW